MPILIKARSQVSRERAINDGAFYYDFFSQLLIDNDTEENTMDTHQQLQRLSRWVKSYVLFATRWHTENFVPCDDLYVDKEDAIRFSYATKIPRAPFIEVFGDIPDASI